MVSGKYAKDYKLENVLGANGRIKTVSVYAGPYFAFKAGAASVKRTRTVCAAMCAAALAAAAVPLFVNTGVVHNYGVVLPFVLGLIPLFNLLAAMYRFIRAGEKVTREHKDKLGGRFLWASAALFVCAGGSMIGQIVWYFGHSAEICFADIAVSICTAVLMAAAAVLFLQKKNLEMKQVSSQ